MNRSFLHLGFTFGHVCKQLYLGLATLSASFSFTSVTIVQPVQNFFLSHDLIRNLTRIIFSFDENFFCVWSSSLEIGFTVVTLLKPITPVAQRYKLNLHRTGVMGLADLMMAIEMLLPPHNSRETSQFGSPLNSQEYERIKERTRFSSARR